MANENAVGDFEVWLKQTLTEMKEDMKRISAKVKADLLVLGRVERTVKKISDEVFQGEKGEMKGKSWAIGNKRKRRCDSAVHTGEKRKGKGGFDSGVDYGVKKNVHDQESQDTSDFYGGDDERARNKGKQPMVYGSHESHEGYYGGDDERARNKGKQPTVYGSHEGYYGGDDERARNKGKQPMVYGSHEGSSSDDDGNGPAAKSGGRYAMNQLQRKEVSAGGDKSDKTLIYKGVLKAADVKVTGERYRLLFEDAESVRNFFTEKEDDLLYKKRKPVEAIVENHDKIRLEFKRWNEGLVLNTVGWKKICESKSASAGQIVRIYGSRGERW